MLAAVAAASTLASCGGDLLDDASGRERRGAAHQKVRVQDRSEQKQHQDVASKQRQSNETKPGTAPGSPAGEESRSQPAGHGPQHPSGAGVGSAPASTKPASSCSSDMTGDMESAGSPPSYADLTRGCVREQGDAIVLEATTAGGLPARMPDPNTHLAIAFSIELPSGPKTYVTAESTDDGWTAYLNRGNARRELPAPAISGQQLRVTLPGSELGGARFQWNVQSSWLRSTLTTTSYAFDDAPNGGTTSFARG